MMLFADSGYRPLPPNHVDHPDISALEADLLTAVGGHERFQEKLRSFFRSAIDEVIDTARTGRYFFANSRRPRKPI